ncbi:hypothetical protein HAX54_052327 [Datura stramonium]|uniref:Uncharacterized protein n=1 Tax=Datura stramonium TaxID=4076 RepID=A0ABS8SZR1_DATST|nr:hypothetical protein [Datura stramonium]
MLMELADHAIQVTTIEETTKGWSSSSLKGEERSTQAEIVGKERQGLGFIQWNFRSRPTQAMDATAKLGWRGKGDNT